MHTFIKCLSFILVLFLIEIVSGNNNIKKRVYINNNEKSFNHIVKYFIKNDNFIDIYTVYNKLTNYDTDEIEKQNEEIILENYKKYFINNFKNGKFTPLPLFMSIISNNTVFPSEENDEAKILEKITTKLYNKSKMLTIKLLIKKRHHNNVIYSEYFKKLFRSIVYYLIPENASLTHIKKVFSKNFSYINKNLSYNCSTEVISIDKINKKKEVCIYVKQNLKTYYTHVQYKSYGDAENIFFNILDYYSQEIKMKNQMDYKKFEFYNPFVMEDNISLKSNKKLHDISLGTYREYLDNDYRLFINDIEKEISDIYFTIENHNNEGKWLKLKKNIYLIGETKEALDQHKKHKSTYSENVNINEDDQINDNNIVYFENIGKDDINDIDDNDDDTPVNEKCTNCSEFDQNGDKMDDKTSLFLLSKYFLNFLINIKKINESCLQPVNVSDQNKNSETPNLHNSFISESQNKENNITIDVNSLNDKNNNGKQIEILINGNIEVSSSKKKSKKRNSKKVRNAIKKSLNKKKDINTSLNEISFLSISSKLQGNDEENLNGNADGDEGEDADKKNRVKRKKGHHPAIRKGKNKIINVSMDKKNENLNNETDLSSTNNTELKQINVLRDITDSVKNDQSDIHIDKVKEEDTPSVAQEERKIDEFYQYENKIIKKIHKDKKNIYEMINKDLDKLLKPAQKEYMNLAKNVKNRLIREYEQILREEISDV